MVQDVKERMYNLKVNPPRKDENRRGGDILQRYKKWYTYTSVSIYIKKQMVRVNLIETLHNIVREGVTAKDVHKAADSVGMKWDNNKKFMVFSKRITGKEHIDDMTSKEREELIKKILKEEKTVFPAQAIIEYWQKELGITDWVITTERISPEQVDYNDATDFIGISRDFPNKTGIIYHDRDLYEEAIIHELVHVQEP